MKKDIIDFIQNNEDYYQDFVVRLTRESNAIEGSSLSIGQTLSILFDIDLGINLYNVKPREILEAINHKKAMDYLFKYIKEDKPFNSDLIKDLNEIILDGIMPGGYYRSTQVIIRGSSHIPPAPHKIHNQMEDMIFDINQKSKLTLEDLSYFHLNFEKIHPFNDGNGRTGRLLINYFLLKQNDYPLVIKNSDRTTYLDCLEQEDINTLTKMFDYYQQVEAIKISSLKNDNN